MSEPLTVVIADDHPLFRKGLVEVLSADPSFRILGEAADGTAALATVVRERPCIAVLDIEMPGTSGLAVAEAIGAERLETHVVMLTMYRSGDMFRRALDLGVKGYVLKDGALNEIVACLHMVGAGRAYISPALSSELIERRDLSPVSELSVLLEALTPAERRVLRLVARGHTSGAIAAELGNSSRTIENHRSHICRKLNLSGPQALLRFVLERKALLG